MHCQQPVEGGGRFCCTGCETAHALLEGAGLERFYALRRGTGLPVGNPRQGGLAWLDHELARARMGRAELRGLTLHLDVEGLHCAGCVWVIEQLFGRLPGGRSVLVNPGRGQLTLRFEDGVFPLEPFIADLSTLGYRAGPARRGRDETSDDLLLRFGVTAALAMNAMILSAAFYFGLEEGSGVVADLFLVTSWALATFATLLALPVFGRGAWLAARRGTVHLDLPIVLGLTLAWAAMTLRLATGSTTSAYFDTLTVFVALVLLGRWLQQRAVAKNRKLVLDAAPDAALYVRRVFGDRVTTVPASALLPGDVFLVLPGDHVPVRATALDDAHDLSLAWISGESTLLDVGAGQEIDAGAHHRGDRAFRARAEEALARSRLWDLLQQKPDDGLDDPGGPRRLAPLYVVAVLVLATAGFVAWTLAAGPGKGLDVAVAILVVSCPCALGLGLPLARELTLARLRRAGVFVRRLSLFDRLPEVERVVFDKTGTLTRRKLRVRNPEALRELDDEARRALGQMVIRSRHPASAALLDAYERVFGAPSLDDAEVREEAGVGLVLDTAGGAHGAPGARRFHLGRPSRRADQGQHLGVTLREERAGELRDLVSVTLDEELRPGARAEVQDLRGRGLEVGILSGDAEPRVKAVAARTGVDDELARGDLKPMDKAADIQRGRPALMIGDGLNDGPAFDAALAAGAVPGEDGALSERADFFLLGEGLSPLSALLDEVAHYRTVLGRNVGLALAYNAITLAVCLAGLMSPLLAAVLMPLSSLTVVGHSVLALRQSSRAAKAPRPLEVPA